MGAGKLRLYCALDVAGIVVVVVDFWQEKDSFFLSLAETSRLVVGAAGKAAGASR
jgi:hypothetical protein